ncbi:MAG: ATP-binding protein [Caldilineaceae bacterium]
MNENSWRAKWSNDEIRAMLFEQFNTFWQHDIGIERTQLAALQQAAALPHAIIISGLRRVGKSTLLAQMAHQLGQENFYYVNFEDERFLGFQADDANDLFAALVETFGERTIFMIDEIQNIPEWERFVRRYMDMGYKFYITGSNASLLSRELGTRLTGRHITIELFPFSFYEYLRFHQREIPDLPSMTTLARAKLARELDGYLKAGGIPDALKYPELPLLRTLYDDVLYRDIATRHRIEAVTVLKELAYYLMSNPTASISFNKLKERFRLGSVNTIKNYIDYLENSWLILTLTRHDYSVARQQMAPKKIYSIDTGLSSTIGFSFSPNTGKHLENLVYLALRRKQSELYYYTTPNGFEVDFYLPAQRQLIQVAQHLANPATREREVRALTDALSGLNIDHAFILADENEDPFEINGVTVEVRSTAEWILAESTP